MDEIILISLETISDIMEQKSKNRIIFIWFLFLFGFILFGSNVSYILSGINPGNALNLMLMGFGVLCVVLAVFLTKRRWHLNTS